MFVLFFRERYPTEVVVNFWSIRLFGQWRFALSRVIERVVQPCTMDNCIDVYCHGGIGAHGCFERLYFLCRTAGQAR